MCFFDAQAPPRPGSPPPGPPGMAASHADWAPTGGPTWDTDPEMPHHVLVAIDTLDVPPNRNIQTHLPVWIKLPQSFPPFFPIAAGPPHPTRNLLTTLSHEMQRERRPGPRPWPKPQPGHLRGGRPGPRFRPRARPRQGKCG